MELLESTLASAHRVTSVHPMLGAVRTLVLSLSGIVINLTSLKDRSYLVGVVAPKTLYRYRSAQNAKIEFMRLLKEGKEVIFSPEHEMQLTKSVFPQNLHDQTRSAVYNPALGNLMMPTPGDLEQIMSKRRFTYSAESGVSGFALLDRPTGKEHFELVAASTSLRSSVGRDGRNRHFSNRTIALKKVDLLRPSTIHCLNFRPV